MITIAFFGTSDRSTPILDVLKTNFNLALCITKTDSKVGRQQKLKESGVKTWAKQNNIEYIETSSLKIDQSKIISRLLELKTDLGVVADFSFIIPQELLSTPKYKLLNIHFSLLPKLRGASPVQFSILDGDTVTGVTYFILGQKMDDGEILTKVEYKTTKTETSGELYATLFALAAENLPGVISKYTSGELRPTPQDNQNATYTYSKSHPKNTFIYKEDARIDWTAEETYIERQIRAYNPWPIAWSTLLDIQSSRFFKLNKYYINKSKDLDLKVKIYKANLDKNALKPIIVQVEGGKTLSWKDFENGYIEKF